MGNLTNKQSRFVEEYLIDMNATRAAIRAGYSAKTAHVIGHENLSKPDVIGALNIKRAKLSERLEITQERILQEYARIGFSDLRKTIKPDGVMMLPQEIDDDTAAAISSLEITDGQVKIKVWDKPKALDAMAKHLGMFEGKKGVDDPEETIEAQSMRAIGRKIAYVLQGAIALE